MVKKIQTENTYFGDTKRDDQKSSLRPAAKNDYRVMEGTGDDNPFAGHAGMFDELNEDGDGELPF